MQDFIPEVSCNKKKKTLTPVFLNPPPPQMSDLGPGIYAVQTVFAPDRNLRNHLGNVNVVASTRDTWEFRMVPGGYFVIVHQPVNGTELVLGTLNRNVAHGVRVVLQARDDSNRSQRWLVVNQGTVFVDPFLIPRRLLGNSILTAARTYIYIAATVGRTIFPHSVLAVW